MPFDVNGGAGLLGSNGRLPVREKPLHVRGVQKKFGSHQIWDKRFITYFEQHILFRKSFSELCIIPCASILARQETIVFVFQLFTPISFASRGSARRASRGPGEREVLHLVGVCDLGNLSCLLQGFRISSWIHSAFGLQVSCDDFRASCYMCVSWWNIVLFFTLVLILLAERDLAA